MYQNTRQAPLSSLYLSLLLDFFVLTLTSRLFDAEYYFLVYIYVSSV